MSCRLYRPALVDLARGATARPETRIAEAHAAACSRCAERLERERRLTSGLRALAAATTPAPANTQLERQLVMAFENLHPPVAAHPRRRWALAAGIAAAVCGIGSGLWIFRPERTTSGGSVPPARTDGTTHPQRARISAPDRSIAGVSHGPTHRPRGRRTTAERRGSAPPEFVPLPSARALPELESGQVFRVVLPVGAMPAYGLEISAGATGEPVTADLLVGQDGQARAIRVITGEIQGGSRQ